MSFRRTVRATWRSLGPAFVVGAVIAAVSLLVGFGSQP